MTGAVGVIARLTSVRIRRGRTKWITLMVMALPVLAALLGTLFDDGDDAWEAATQLGLRWVVPLAAALHLANGVGEEIESRTFTYLWSRPFPRPALLFGKLLAVVPIVAGLSALSLGAAYVVSYGGIPDPAYLVRVLVGVTAGTAAAGAFAIGAGSLFPKNPLVFVMGYMLVGEQFVSFIPNVRYVSYVFHSQVLAGVPVEWEHTGSAAESAVMLALLAAVWLGVGTWRVVHRELALPDG